MKKIITFLTIAIIFTMNAFAQVDCNKREFSCQIIEHPNNKIEIVSNYDYLGENFWKQNIEIQLFKTVTDAISYLEMFGFQVKTDVSHDGKRTITMAKIDYKSSSVSAINRQINLATELEKMFSNKQ